MRRDGESYQGAMERVPGARLRELQLPLELAGPRPGEHLLDIPSGGAYLRPVLAAHCPGCHYIPFETKPDYSAWVPDLVLGDWLALPFADASLEIVLSLTTLHHMLEGRAAFYREVARVLAPGGRLVVADVAQRTAPARWLDEIVHRYSSPGHTALFLDAARETEDLRAAGLTVSHADIARYTWDFEDRPTAVSFMTALFRLDRATPAHVEEAIGDVLGWANGPGAPVRWELLLLRGDKET